MIQFTTTIKKFDKKGEKTGWTYIEISSPRANKLNKGEKVSFRVKGKLDQHGIEKTALIPMGNGDYILPLNGEMRKATGKKLGDKIQVTLEVDRRELVLSGDLMTCLHDDPLALEYFKSLPKSHQHYFSKWIESAKTTPTKTKRIVMAVSSLSQKQGFSEMIRANKSERF